MMHKILEDRSLLVKSSATYGGYLGATLIVLAVIEYLTGPSELVGLLNYFVFVGGILQFSTIYRDRILGGSMQYKQALRFGTLLCVFAAILMGAYTAVLYTIINPEIFEESIAATAQQLVSNGVYSEHEVASALELVGHMSSPINFMFASILGYTGLGFFVSLFTAFFVQKAR
ncbi:MAG: DUF4199 domain-containing protein [Bacteroidales bacterium]